MISVIFEFCPERHIVEMQARETFSPSENRGTRPPTGVANENGNSKTWQLF
jgi:hypothetical protein